MHALVVPPIASQCEPSSIMLPQHPISTLQAVARSSGWGCYGGGGGGVVVAVVVVGVVVPPPRRRSPPRRRRRRRGRRGCGRRGGVVMVVIHSVELNKKNPSHSCPAGHGSSGLAPRYPPREQLLAAVVGARVVVVVVSLARCRHPPGSLYCPFGLLVGWMVI